MPKRGAAVNAALECAIGLVKNDDKQYIPLRLKSGNVFETVNTVAPGTKFKMEIKRIRWSVIHIYSDRKPMEAVTPCSLIPVKKMQPKLRSRLIAHHRLSLVSKRKEFGSG